jgi:hypothetical protein
MSIKRITGKETVQYTLQQYGDELAESSIAEKRTNIGELVIDVGGSPDNPTLWVANINGFLNQIQGGGNGGGNGAGTMDGTAPGGGGAGGSHNSGNGANGRVIVTVW